MKFVVRIQYYLFKLSKFANKIYRYKNQLNSVLVRLGNRLGTLFISGVFGQVSEKTTDRPSQSLGESLDIT